MKLTKLEYYPKIGRLNLRHITEDGTFHRYGYDFGCEYTHGETAFISSILDSRVINVESPIKEVIFDIYSGNFFFDKVLVAPENLIELPKGVKQFVTAIYSFKFPDSTFGVSELKYLTDLEDRTVGEERLRKQLQELARDSIALAAVPTVIYPQVAAPEPEEVVEEVVEENTPEPTPEPTPKYTIKSIENESVDDILCTLTASGNTQVVYVYDGKVISTTDPIFAELLPIAKMHVAEVQEPSSEDLVEGKTKKGKLLYNFVNSKVVFTWEIVRV